MSELKPCPFCGGPAELDTRRAYCALGTGLVGDGIAVYCVGGCAADMMVCREDVPDIDAEQVVEMWNRRAAAPPPVADAVKDRWGAVESAVEEYLADYVFEADGGGHVPTEDERLMLADAIHGLLADDDSLRAITAALAARGKP